MASWVTNLKSGTVTEISSNGSFLSGASGFTGLTSPWGVAIDQSNQIWISNYAEPSTIAVLSQAGTLISNGGAGPYDDAGQWGAEWLAIDGLGNAWIPNSILNSSVTELSNTGSVLSTSYRGPYFYGGGMDSPPAVAIDGSGNAWITNVYSSLTGSSITKISSSGVFLSGTYGFTLPRNLPGFRIAIDGQGAAWVGGGATSSGLSNTVFKMSSSGTRLFGFANDGSNCLVAPSGVAIDGSGMAWYSNKGSVANFSSDGTSGACFKPNGAPTTTSGDIAIDGSGNVWLAEYGTDSVVELIGIAAPVITPIAAGLPATPTSDGSSHLGTRP